MTLNEMIYHRKSCRSFTNVPVDAAAIEAIKAFERVKKSEFRIVGGGVPDTPAITCFVCYLLPANS